ncbi:MAG: DUF3576 domain-containing protein [Alphaproteobacteria bacterium]
MDIDHSYPDPLARKESTKGKLFGDGGISLFNSEKDARPASEASMTGMLINKYLWRASLDTISFVPLVSADPFGGTIITDWYMPADTPTERFKLNIFILDEKFSVNSLKVSVFSQKRGADNLWRAAPTSPTFQVSIENAIFTRARQIKFREQVKP